MNSRDDLSTPWATQLIRHAARRAPTDLSERLEEEWLADLDTRKGTLSRLRLAAGCYWATQVIARDPIFARAPVRVAAAPGAVAVHAPFDGFGFSRRTVMLCFIAGLHVAAIYYFTVGLHVPFTKPTLEPIRWTIIDEPPLPEPQPPDVFSGLKNSWGPKPEVPQLPVFSFPSDPVVDPAKDPTLTIIEPVGPVGPPTVTRVVGGPGAGFPNTRDFYPAMSRSLGEVGAAIVQVCVDAQGKLTAAPQIHQTSGYARLDAGALALAKAGSGRYRSTTENGQPVTSCYPFRVRFSLTN